MATAARKDLVRALKALFADPGDDFEPPEALLDDIDTYATSSDIVSSVSDHDTGKLRDALLHACFEEGILQHQHSSTARSQQLRSILIIVLDRFASAGSDVVTTKQIIEVWWKRLLKPALLASEESLESDKLHLGRKAAHSAKDLVVRALIATADAEAVEGGAWRNSLFEQYTNSANGTFAQRNLQNILIAFGRSSPSSHAKIFFTKLEELMTEAPIASLRLCNNFIRIHPGQAYHALSTALFSTIVKRLNSLEPSQRNTNTARELVWVSSSLTGLSMLLPQVSPSIEKHLEDLFLAFVHVLLWYARSFAGHSSILEEGQDAAGEEASNSAAAVLTPLLDYCTTLYGLLPSNFLSFLGAPTTWLQNQRMKLQQQRRASSSRMSVTSARSELQSRNRSRRASSSTSDGLDMADEAAEQAPLPGESAADAEARVSAARKLRSKAHGKGRRSKVSKQRRDAVTRQKKAKTMEKQKEREKRRRGESEAEKESTKATGKAAEPPQVDQGSELQSVGMTRQTSSSSTSQHPAQIAGSQAAQSTYADSTSSNSSSSDEFDPEDLELLPDLQTIDWELVRRLAEPYLTQHLVSAGALVSPSVELSATRLRFKKTEASDLIHEIVRTRPPNAVSDTVHNPIASPVPEDIQSPAPFSPMTTASSSYQIEIPEAISLLQNQLIFETHLKDQLIHRLGALLREHIVAGGAEADRQNLMQTVKLLRTQLSDAQETLTVVRKEAARSRELLNEYSSSQAKRVEILREERRAWTAEGSRLRAELEDAQSSVEGLNIRLAEAEKTVFEYENEEKHRKEMQEKVEAERELEMESLRAEIAELKAANSTSNQEEAATETE